MKLVVNNFADDWIRTGDFWCRKRPLYELSHKQCPKFGYITYQNIKWVIYAK